METLALVLPLAILAIVLSFWAHAADERRSLAITLFVLFGAFSLMMILFGSAVVVLADELQRQEVNDVFDARNGMFMILMGLAVGLPLLPPVRAILARVTPMSYRSIPDMVGLSVMAGVAVLMIWTIDLANGEVEVSPVGAFELILQALLLVIIAYFGIGGLIRRDLSNVRHRLGLHMPTSRQATISVLLIIPILMVSAAAGALTEWLQPGLVDQIEDVMGEVTRDVANVQGAILLGVTAGVGEEILFRGAIQPRFGLLIASLVFTLIHVQYALSFVLLGVFLTAVILGIQRYKMNTTCCIITHAVYNFTVVMVSTLA